MVIWGTQMFADHWVIALMVGQVSSLILVSMILLQALRIIGSWSPGSGSELQIIVERKTYLISAVIKYVLIFQVVSLLLFLITVNNHLPGLIKGAMCASGTLMVNRFGYPLLYLKITAVLLYGVFLFINYVDNSEPEYPLTPLKFWLVPLIFILILSDVLLQFNYFGAIEPDIIATCCSISFSLSTRRTESYLQEGQWIEVALPVFYLISFLLVLSLLLKKRQNLLSLLLILFFIPVSLYVLKYHFVKFIYALPTHNCLFDIFWKNYYYIGYLLFGTLLVSVLLIIMINLYRFFQKRLQKGHPRLIDFMRWLTVACIGLFVIMNSVYWLYWRIFRL